MSFLDRFKPHPKWKHADSAVRLASVDELMLDDPEQQRALVELAGTDEDVRVRRAAVSRIEGVADLVPLASAERDEQLRRELTDRLVAIATAPSDSDGDAALALEGLEDQKQLASVAKSSPHETVRTAALGRVHDVRTLSGVARHALDPQTALDAVARVPDPAELLNIALKTEHKDAGLAALERITAAGPSGEVRTTLELAATRAKNKSVAKRARTMLQTIEEAAAAERAALEQWRQRVALVLARVEALAAAPVGADTSVQLANAEADWLELAGSGTFAVDPDTNARFGALVTDAHGAIERFEQERAERRAAEERRVSLRAAKQELCERVEALRGEDTLEAIDKARGEWEGLLNRAADADQDAPVVDESDAELHSRFEDACRRAAERQANRQAVAQIGQRLDALSREAERIASAGSVEPVDHIEPAQWEPSADAVQGERTGEPVKTEPVGEPINQAAWGQIAAEWTSLIGKAEDLAPPIAQRFADAERKMAERAAERRAAEERVARQHVQRIEQLIERAQTRAAAEDLTLREADRIGRDLRSAMEAPAGPLAENNHERHTLIERLKGALAVVTPRLQDLREMDEWKRFANAAVQEELIARTEALRTKYHFEADGAPSTEDIEKAARELHEIQERWKQVAEAPRAQAQALWHRYRQAADPIQARAREFFAARSEERKGNLDRKLALIERAEALADSTDWIKTADQLKKLQHEWQLIGAVPRNDTRATWKRFREACDKFFSRRNADLAERKETWSANLAKKEALCARAEELSASREWDRAAAEIRRLQSEWKTIGPVRRNKSEGIWQRFRTGCDAFFERFKRRDAIDLEAKQADREALLSELESLAEPPSAASPEPTPANLLERVRSLRTRWNQTSSVVRQGADPLSERFVDALERVMLTHPDQFRGTELDVDASRQKMEKLVAKVEGFLSDAAPTPSNSSQALADMLREALASNTIGGRGSDEARWRAMGDDVRQAQASWSRLGPVPGQTGRELTERFHRACNRFFDQYRRRVPPQQQGGGRRKELQAR
jgi:Domain of Unknown Function (DUF349)